MSNVTGNIVSDAEHKRRIAAARKADPDGKIAAKEIRAMRRRRFERYLDSVGGKPWAVWLVVSNKAVDIAAGLPRLCGSAEKPAAFRTLKEAEAYRDWIAADWRGYCMYEVRRVEPRRDAA